MGDRCVMCGDPVPEGRQVCPNCEARVMEGDDYHQRYWIQNMLIAETYDALSKLKRDIEWVMKHPMQACKLCSHRDEECSRYGVECKPNYDGGKNVVSTEVSDQEPEAEV